MHPDMIVRVGVVGVESYLHALEVLLADARRKRRIANAATERSATSSISSSPHIKPMLCRHFVARLWLCLRPMAGIWFYSMGTSINHTCNTILYPITFSLPDYMAALRKFANICKLTCLFARPS